MLRILQFRLILPMILLGAIGSPAQSVLGKWELKGTYLEIGYTSKWKILKVKTPETRFRETSTRSILELHEDGRIRLGGEWGTYSLTGNSLSATFARESEAYTFFRGQDDLTLWLKNQVSGMSKSDAKSRAIVLARQMGLYDQFTGLGETDEVYSVKIGLSFVFKGNLPGIRNSQNEVYGRTNSTRQVQSTPSNCLIAEGVMQGIISKAEDIAFDDEKLKYLQSAIVNRKCFSTEQVGRMLALLAFDKEKLPLAKTAYKYVIDKEAFYELEESFDFIDTKKEFRQMIR